MECPMGKALCSRRKYSLPRFALLMLCPSHSKGYSTNTLHYRSLLVKVDSALDYLACTLWSIIILNNDGKMLPWKIAGSMYSEQILCDCAKSQRRPYVLRRRIEAGTPQPRCAGALELLTDIIPEDCSIVPKTPYFFPNAVWDSSQDMKERSGMNELEKVHMAEAMILRTKQIC